MCEIVSQQIAQSLSTCSQTLNTSTQSTIQTHSRIESNSKPSENASFCGLNSTPVSAPS